MGFFDPAHKKMLAQCPPHFQAGARHWGIFLDGALELRSPLNPDIIRALVVGMLAVRSAGQSPTGWTQYGLNYVTGRTNNAYKALQPEDRMIGEEIFAAIVTTMEGETDE